MAVKTPYFLKLGKGWSPVPTASEPLWRRNKSMSLSGLES
jgi:hypothetical protein